MGRIMAEGQRGVKEADYGVAGRYLRGFFGGPEETVLAGVFS